MPVKFSDLKKKMKNIDSIVEATKSKGEYEKDTRFWNIVPDKAGNAEAVIRFLPAHPDEDVPWIETFRHRYQNQNNEMWLYCECPTTIGGKCPVCDDNTKLWNSGVDADKKLASARKREHKFIANIYVVSDPANPENEGKVFLYRFGAQVMKKITNAIDPPYASKKRMNPFDLLEGANFILRSCKKTDKGSKKAYLTFDDSEFDAVAPLLDGDESELEKIWLAEYPLKPFHDKERFDSYEKILERLRKVMGSPASETTEMGEDEDAIPSRPSRHRVETTDDDEDVPAFIFDDSSSTTTTPSDDDFFDEIAF